MASKISIRLNYNETHLIFKGLKLVECNEDDLKFKLLFTIWFLYDTTN